MLGMLYTCFHPPPCVKHSRIPFSEHLRAKRGARERREYIDFNGRPHTVSLHGAGSIGGEGRGTLCWR